MLVEYTDTDMKKLSLQDPNLAALILRYGHIEREADEDVFSSAVHQIIAQQISSKAEQTIWKHLRDSLGEINLAAILAAGSDGLRKCGVSARKAEYILAFANAVQDGSLLLEELESAEDEQAIEVLTRQRGIGRWTAEMVLLFGLGRQDILSFADYGIRKGLCLLYGRKTIDGAFFEDCRQRFSPYGSIASLYLWKLAQEGR